MRISEYFGLNRRQSELDFVDVDTAKDVPVYIDPSSIRWLSDDWHNQCNLMLTTYFDSVLDAVRNGDEERVLELLLKLREPNETHLGVSKGKSAGRALGAKSVRQLATKISESRAAQTGLIADLEDTALFIDGVGKDVISDITTNIIRGTLITYTQSMCRFYGIPTEEVPSGFVWDSIRQEWEHNLINLPVTEDGKLLLVPKVIVRNGLHMTKDEFLRHHLVPALVDEEMEDPSSKLVKTVQRGDKLIKEVNREDVMRHYGTSKSAVGRLGIERPKLVNHYRDTKKKSHSLPLNHEDLAAATKSRNVDFRDLLTKVLETPVGGEHAHTYHHHVEALISALFYPELSFPKKEENIHEGRKRIDIQYTNTSQRGFFSWLVGHGVSCKYISVECKNYGSEIGNPELDQLSSRFSPLRGMVGILACRSIKNKDLALKKCRDTALDYRGFLIVVDDSDLESITDTLVQARTLANNPKSTKEFVAAEPWQYPLIQERFDKLIH